jgi:hypothetical protein
MFAFASPSNRARLSEKGDDMPTQKEPFRAIGTLRGQGRERSCSVQGTRVKIFADEVSAPLKVVYEKATIDHDDFPDGDYEVNFDGQTILLTRKSGFYLARQ